MYAVWCCIAVCSYSAVWRCMAVWRRGEGVTMRDTCMEQYSCMVSCMVFLLYSTKWRTETHADSVPVGEDGVTEGVGRYPAPMAACTAAWAHPGHAPLPRHARHAPCGTVRAVWQAVWNSAVFRCISLYVAPYMHHASSRLPPGTIQPHSAIQRHIALYEHTAIQHHTAYSPYTTPQLWVRRPLELNASSNASRLAS